MSVGERPHAGAGGLIGERELRAGGAGEADRKIIARQHVRFVALDEQSGVGVGGDVESIDALRGVQSHIFELVGRQIEQRNDYVNRRRTRARANCHRRDADRVIDGGGARGIVDHQRIVAGVADHRDGREDER